MECTNKQTQEQAIMSNIVAQQLLAMERKVYLYQTTAMLVSNRTGQACDGSPVEMGWYESEQKAILSYQNKHPQVVQDDLRGVWKIVATRMS